ncbi:MAG: hypothetical protein AB1941_19110 [Gemmatimonadota bacterium]
MAQAKKQKKPEGSPPTKDLVQRGLELAYGRTAGQLAERLDVTPHALTGWRRDADRGGFTPTPEHVGALGLALIEDAAQLEAAGRELVKRARREGWTPPEAPAAAPAELPVPEEEPDVLPPEFVQILRERAPDTLARIAPHTLVATPSGVLAE